MNPSLAKGIQHDAHECLIKLLDIQVDQVSEHLSRRIQVRVSVFVVK